jgi:hypothetical protein
MLTDTGKFPLVKGVRGICQTLSGYAFFKYRGLIRQCNDGKQKRQHDWASYCLSWVVQIRYASLGGN